MLTRSLVTLSALLTVSAFSTTATAADSCGSVTIADMNWNSASLLAHVDQYILQHGFGCDAELVPGDTVPTGTSMIEKGEPDVAPELWQISLKTALDKGVAEKRLRYAGQSLSDGGEEGFWVPEYMVKKMPELATIEGIRKHAKLFTHPEDPDKSMMMGCPAGWACQISASNIFDALKLEESGFELVDPGSGAGLSGAIAKAYERKEPWFGYYWAPTAVLGKYKMVKVDFGSGVDQDHYMKCLTQPDCLEPKVSMYPSSPVYTVTTESFATESPAAYSYLTSRSFTNKQMNELLAWMESNQADGEFAALHFLENYSDIWTAWVPSKVADKIKSSM